MGSTAYRARWLTVLAAAAFLTGSLPAQTEGPLTVKRPPRRPPSREQPSERPAPARPEQRPVLRRSEPAVSPSPTGGACPEGYIAIADPSADERPRLTRNPSPEPDAGASPASAVKCVAAETTPAVSFFDQVRANALEFSARLPDFICTQFTRRYEMRTAGSEWSPIDRVQADLVYVDGAEEYRNFRRNGRQIASPVDTGAWSNGEFGTLMLGLFSPQSNVQFNPAGDSEINGVPARMFDFSVRQEDSRWHLDLSGQTIDPAYKGTVWVDPERHRVLRIEMQTVDLPAGYPLATLETSVDYAPVVIGSEEYLLPTVSETLSCQRRSSRCLRNETEFRDYRKFTVETSISPAEPEDAESQPE